MAIFVTHYMVWLTGLFTDFHFHICSLRQNQTGNRILFSVLVLNIVMKHFTDVGEYGV